MTPVSNKLSHRCGKKRQLSGTDRWCDRGWEHESFHHAITLTGVDRYCEIGIPGEYATEYDLSAEIARRQDAAAAEQGGLLSSLDSKGGSHD